MSSTIARGRSAVAELLPDIDDVERTQGSPWTSTGNGFPHAALPAADEWVEPVTKLRTRPAYSDSFVHYIPTGHDFSHVALDCYGDLISSPGQRETGQSDAESPCASPAPCHSISRYIPVASEPSDVAWDCYGDPASTTVIRKSKQEQRERGDMAEGR